MHSIDCRLYRKPVCLQRTSAENPTRASNSDMVRLVFRSLPSRSNRACGRVTM